MNRALQLQLSQMSFTKFSAWLNRGHNADLLPLFHNQRWLQDSGLPKHHIFASVQRWVEKYPYPTEEDIVELRRRLGKTNVDKPQ